MHGKANAYNELTVCAWRPSRQSACHHNKLMQGVTLSFSKQAFIKTERIDVRALGLIRLYRKPHFITLMIVQYYNQVCIHVPSSGGLHKAQTAS